MAKWAHSLIRISNFEVETLQKQLAELTTKRAQIEMRLATLDAQCEIEVAQARQNPSHMRDLQAYLSGFRHRRDALEAELMIITQEEEALRDQLSLAFESLKKFEHVAEVSRLKKIVRDNAIEQAQMDETSLRLSQK